MIVVVVRKSLFCHNQGDIMVSVSSLITWVEELMYLPLISNYM